MTQQTLTSRATYDDRTIPAKGCGRKPGSISMDAPEVMFLQNFMARPERACHVTVADLGEFDYESRALRHYIGALGLPLRVREERARLTVHINKEDTK